MADLVYLRDLVIILGLAVAVVATLHRVGVPSIAGFILAGILVGPEGLGVIDDVHKVELLAEIGVALLLFGIGLELSLDRLKRLWVPVMIGGALQVGLTIAATFTAATAFGLAARPAVFVGFLVAVSSTAIVLRGLETRGEIDAPHGRLTLGILVFQDLCVVPMMLLVPVLGGADASTGELTWALLRALAIVGGVVLAALLIVPRILRIIARTRQRHLFILTVLLVCIGTAWAASSAGVALALGAFLAGLVVAGSEYRHQALADLISFKDVFTSLFFISIGMLFSISRALDSYAEVLLLLAALLIGKFILVFATGMIMRLPLRVSILAGAALAQMGEFSFILMHAAGGTELLAPEFQSNLTAAAILSMLITPFGLILGPHLAAGAGKLRVFTRLMEVASAEELQETGDHTLRDHVIIGGYGFAGRELARVLKEARCPFIVVELSVDNIRQATQDGHRACFGDVTSPEVLYQLDLARARELVLVINDPDAVARSVRAARIVAPDVHIMVRTRYLLDITPLAKAGASEIVPAEREAAVEVVTRVLRRYGLEEDQIQS
ncbi:hypothetical protein GF377_00020, partial [candidate division GN15 bacterium]|nr:hypothetical protein [candidate division GN15 bacterium]